MTELSSHSNPFQGHLDMASLFKIIFCAVSDSARYFKVFFHITPEDVARICVNIVTFSDDLHCI